MPGGGRGAAWFKMALGAQRAGAPLSVLRQRALFKHYFEWAHAEFSRMPQTNRSLTSWRYVFFIVKIFITSGDFFSFHNFLFVLYSEAVHLNIATRKSCHLTFKYSYGSWATRLLAGVDSVRRLTVAFAILLRYHKYRCYVISYF